MSFKTTNSVCIVAPHLLDISWSENATLAELNLAVVPRNFAPIGVLGFAMVFGLLGNSVMLHIIRTKYKHSNYRICSLWLASMDIAGALTVMPFFIHLFLTEISYPNEILCRTGITTAAIFLFSCHLILLGIAIERYMKIYHPFRRQLSGRNLNFIFVIFIVVSVVFAAPHAIFAGERTVDTGVNGIKAKLCFVSDDHIDSYLPGKYYTAINLLSVTMSIIIIITYTRIVHVITRFSNYFKRNKEISHECEDNPPLFMNTSRTKEMRQTTFTLIAASICFIIPTFPFTIMAMVAMYTQQPVLCNVPYINAIIFRVIASSVLLNSVVNPFIYGFADPHFRRELKKLCCCR